MDIQNKERIEIDYWKNSEFERPEKFTLENYDNKMGDARVFQDLLKKYLTIFEKAELVLEIGAGQGWASCIVKKQFPDKKMIVTDISEYAIESLKYWEEKFSVSIEQRYAAKSYDLPVNDSIVDVMFCFSSAHHFVLYPETLKEVQRVLKQNGCCLWLYEPSSPGIFYKLVKRRLNNIRQIVPEDVLVIRKLKAIASELSLDLRVDYYPSVIKRGKLEKIYFRMLRIFPFLNFVLPATVNVIIRKMKE